MEDDNLYTLINYLPQALFMLLLLCFSAFFSATETAFFSLTREEIKRFGKSNSKSERLVKTLLQTPKNLLTTILFGNMLANIGFFCVSYSIAQRIAEDSSKNSFWIAGAVCSLSLLTIIILGEVIPKNIAVKIPDQYSRLMAIPIYAFDKLFFPFRIILTSIIHVISKIFDRGEGEEKCVTIDELKMLVEFSEKQGIVDQEEKSMIHGILDFKRAQIKEIMIPRVDMKFYDIADPVEGLITLARETKHTKFPIYEDTPDNVIGVVHAKDFFLEPNVQLRSILKPIQFVPEPKSIEGLLRQFRREGSQMAIVVDEHGGTAGLITLEDIIEEIVGEIQDEHEKPRETINKIEENKYLISGNLSLRDWAETFGVEIEPMGVDTLGGLVIALLEHIPKKGDSVKYEDFIFTVDSVRKRRITSILQEIKVIDEQEEDKND